MHALIVTDAAFSWHATFEPFRGELPRSAAGWLDFGAVTDEGPINDIVRRWESSDRLERVVARRRERTAVTSDQVEAALVKAGYFDLATGAATHSAVSIDRRHAQAVQQRMVAGDAHRVGGHYALELLLPTDFHWDDIPDLRRHRSIERYRAVVREIESAALASPATSGELDDAIRHEYANQVDAASRKGIPFKGRVALQGVGFIAGVAADAAAPLVGGGIASVAAFAAGEVVGQLMRARWLSVDRRIRGRRNGL